MALNKIISLVTKEGHEYAIKLDTLNLEVIPEGVQVPVVNITIELLNDVEKTNNARTLFDIARELNVYANENDVILYSYCDNVSIKKSKRKEHITNQHFRSMLFIKMFEKQNNENYFNEQIIIDDPQNGNHYIHLFSKIHNKPSVEIIANEIQNFKNK